MPCWTPSAVPQAGVLLAEFAAAEGGGEGGPGGWGDEQGGTGGLLGVAHRDGGAEDGDFDAVGLVGAAAARPLAGGAQVRRSHAALPSNDLSDPRFRPLATLPAPS